MRMNEIMELWQVEGSDLRRSGGRGVVALTL